jgi:hypothetical protein
MGIELRSFANLRLDLLDTTDFIAPLPRPNRTEPLDLEAEELAAWEAASDEAMRDL